MYEDILKMIDTNMTIEDPHYTFNGIPVPRVTEILSFIDMESLIGWANYMGFKHKKHKDILEEAAAIGSLTHGNIEKYFKGEEIEDSNTPFQAFLLWWEKINQGNNVKIIGQEQQLTCPYFGGTYDMLLSINGKIYLIDFKTSNHVGYKYFMQLAAYRYMLYTNMNISINGCIILQLNKNDVSFEEYPLNFENNEEYTFIEECTRAFFSLVFLYYNVYKVKQDFNLLF